MALYSHLFRTVYLTNHLSYRFSSTTTVIFTMPHWPPYLRLLLFWRQGYWGDAAGSGEVDGRLLWLAGYAGTPLLMSRERQSDPWISWSAQWYHPTRSFWFSPPLLVTLPSTSVPFSCGIFCWYSVTQGIKVKLLKAKNGGDTLWIVTQLRMPNSCWYHVH